MLEFLSQSNRSADIVDLEDRFKFVYDLSILEIVNLLTVGITSFNLKYSIPADIHHTTSSSPQATSNHKHGLMKSTDGRKTNRWL